MLYFGKVSELTKGGIPLDFEQVAQPGLDA